MQDIKDKLNIIEAKVDEQAKILASVDKTLALQAQQLENHIKRTELAEANIALLRKEFKPVQRHVEFLNDISKLITLIGVIAGIAYSIWAIKNGHF